MGWLRSLKLRAALACTTVLLAAACNEQAPQVAISPLVLQVPAGDEELVRALADSLWAGYAAPADTIAFSPGRPLRVVLRPGALVGHLHLEQDECISDPIPGPALARVGRAAWRVYGQAHGATEVEVVAKAMPVTVKHLEGSRTCGGQGETVHFRPELWPVIPV